jgi:uncharacterized BrkB/YihY/UPF0761 family membrane protein
VAAPAVKDVLAPARGTSSDVSVAGVVLLVVAILSFSQGMQRMFEQTWELKPLSVRNTVNDLIWIVGLVGYVAFSWWIRSLLDDGRFEIVANLVLLPASAIFFGWSGWVLSAKRIERRGLISFAILGAVLFAICLTGAAVYVPHLFSSYASRYGAIGAVLAMISTLFALMVACRLRRARPRGVRGACSYRARRAPTGGRGHARMGGAHRRSPLALADAARAARSAPAPGFLTRS